MIRRSPRPAPRAPLLAPALSLVALLFAAGTAASFVPSRSAPEGDRALILLSTSTVEACVAVERAVESEGGRVAFVFRPSVVTAFLPPLAAARIAERPEVLDVRTGPADPAAYGALTREQEAGLAIWNDIYMGLANRGGPVHPEGGPGPGRDYSCGIPVPERHRGTTEDFGKKGYGAGWFSTSEYMILDGPGSRHKEFHVNFVFPESNGAIDQSTENWTLPDMQLMMAECVEGIEWWIARYSPARLSITVATTWAVPSPWEPINHTHAFDSIWVDDLMDTLGYGGSSHFNKVRNFDNNYLVSANEAWFNTVFVVNSKNDPDGRFTDNWFDYSYFGGPYMVMTWDNGPWGNGNTDYLCAHETGHTFYALDEYAASQCRDTTKAGYLRIENGNCENDGGDTVACIMRNNTRNEYTNGSACTFTRGQIGWVDTDGDSIPDIVDHPPILASVPPADTMTCDSTPTYNGSVVPEVEPNRNPARYSSGSSSGDSISVSRVALVEYRVDGGPWQPATPADGAWDEADESYSFSPVLLPGGRYAIDVRATNSRDLYSTIAAHTISVRPGWEWTDNFEDGDVSDWTIASTGGSSITLDNTQSHGGIYSIRVIGSQAQGDYATATSPTIAGPPMPYIDTSEPYTIEFWFRWSSFHWARLVLFGHVGIIIDQPGLAILYDKNGDWSGLTSLGGAFQGYIPSNTWRKVDISVTPSTRQYTVTLAGTLLGTATYNASFTPTTELSFKDHGSSTDFMNSWYDDFLVTGCAQISTEVAGEGVDAPELKALDLRVAPNPFNPLVEIRYRTPPGEDAALSIYDVAGALVRTLSVGGELGWGSVFWNGRDEAGRSLPSGVYFVRLRAGEEDITRKVVFLR
ncbi:MAG: T9SS type A sorting domain-containing protein [Candidatus Eisenbacteria bacterium]